MQDFAAGTDDLIKDLMNGDAEALFPQVLCSVTDDQGLNHTLGLNFIT